MGLKVSLLEMGQGIGSLVGCIPEKKIFDRDLASLGLPGGTVSMDVRGLKAGRPGDMRSDP